MSLNKVHGCTKSRGTIQCQALDRVFYNVVSVLTLQTSLPQEDEDYITQPQTKGNKNEKKDKLNLQSKECINLGGIPMAAPKFTKQNETF